VTSTWDLDTRFREAVARLAAEPAGHPAAPGSDAAETHPAAPISDHTDLTGAQVRQLFEAQMVSRQLDLAASWLDTWGEGFHAANSAGHEPTAVVAACLRPTDPALLHPRSGGFYCARAAQVPASDPVLDVLAAVLGTATEPMAGGRHEPYGSRPLSVIPTSSNGSSHLPRALGLAFGLERVRRLRISDPLGAPDDSVVLCAFAGAEVNHATTVAALNAAGWCAHMGLPMPLLFLCQDDTSAAAKWVAEALRSRPGVEYFAADGCELPDTHRAATQAVRWVRERRRPAVLHLDLVTLTDLDSDHASRDPLLATATFLVSAGLADPQELLDAYDQVGWRVRRAAEQLVAEPKLGSTREVTAPLAPGRPLRVAQAAATPAEATVRAERFADGLPEEQGRLTLAQGINRALHDVMAAYPAMVTFGPGVAAGGDHGVTAQLRASYGAARVFDTFADETSVLGLASGSALAGLLPVAEIPRLAQLHSAVGQLRDEAAATQFFSQGAYRNPMVIRVAGLAAADGRGGHSCNENAVGALREIPGLVIAVPARADDAAGMLRTCLAAAHTDGTCCVFLEPTPLYHQRDLHAKDDGEWLAAYQPPDRWAAAHVPVGRARLYGEGRDITFVTYGSGVRSSLRIAGRLALDGVTSRVVDLRWLAPLPVDDVVREANVTGRVLVVDEARRSGGIADTLVAGLLAAGFVGRLSALASEDSYVPLGPAAEHVLVTEDAVEQAARMLIGQPR
jgi:2-oxoisovalerate dehydrogenase E1 component